MSDWITLWGNKPKYQEGDFAPCHYGDVTVDEPTGKYDERLDEWLEKIKEEGDKLQSQLDFIWEMYGKAKNEELTKDALYLKIASLEQKLMVLGGERSE